MSARLSEKSATPSFTLDEICAAGELLPVAEIVDLIDPVDERQMKIGRRVSERYHLDAPLDGAGVGHTYAATQVDRRVPVIIKLLSPHTREGAASFAAPRFVAEIARVALLSHANIVALREYGQTDDGELFIVLEPISGRTLERVLAEDGPIPFGRLIPMAIEIGRALQAAHEQGVVHGDLNPKNVIVAPGRDGRDRVQVLDFGLAKLSEESEPGSSSYISPEQITQQRTDARSDLYALGALMYHLASGVAPVGASPHAAIASVGRRRPCPATLETIVHRCLAESREARFASAAELIAALGHREPTGPVASAVEPRLVRTPTPLPRVKPRRTWLGALIAGLSIAAASTLLVVFVRAQDRAASIERPLPPETPALQAAVEPAPIREAQVAQVAQVAPVMDVAPVAPVAQRARVAPRRIASAAARRDLKAETPAIAQIEEQADVAEPQIEEPVPVPATAIEAEQAAIETPKPADETPKATDEPAIPAEETAKRDDEAAKPPETTKPTADKPKTAKSKIVDLGAARFGGEDRSRYALMSGKCTKCHELTLVLDAVRAGQMPISRRPFDENGTKAQIVRCMRLTHSGIDKDDAREIMLVLKSARGIVASERE